MPNESHADESRPAVPAEDRPVPADPGGEEPAIETSEHEVRVRRTPRYGRFMILGGAIFAVAAFIVTYSFPQGVGYDRNTVFGFVLLAAVTVGVALGGLVSLLAAAAARRTTRTVLAENTSVRFGDTDDADVDADARPAPGATSGDGGDDPR